MEDSTTLFPFFKECTRHIYMSFNLQGTAITFADHLYTSLTKVGLLTYSARRDLRTGNEEYDQARVKRTVKESNSSLIIFTRDHALSPICLDELVVILDCVRESDHRVVPVYYDVDPSEIRRQLGSIGDAFRLHEQQFESEIDTQKRRLWKMAFNEVADLAGLVVPNLKNGHEAKVIQKIVKVMEDKVSRIILKGPARLVGMYSRAKNINLWLQDGDL